MSMNIVVRDFLNADCEMSGKSDVECVRVMLDDQTPEAVISVAEFVKQLRFKKKQAEKNGRPGSPQSAPKPVGN